MPRPWFSIRSFELQRETVGETRPAEEQASCRSSDLWSDLETPLQLVARTVLTSCRDRSEWRLHNIPKGSYNMIRLRPGGRVPSENEVSVYLDRAEIRDELDLT